MLIIDTSNTNPLFNLAAEEYFFKKHDREVFMVYVNDSSVVIGKHQNPFEEANIRYLGEKNIPLIRRISGGGTVYHDKGNLNYTYIRNSPDGKQVNLKEYTQPIISFLNKSGVNAYRGEKNEIRSGGLKISGNAEHVFKNRVLHHGTILFDVDMKKMSACLSPPNAEIVSRSVKSNRTEVCNIKGIINDTEDIYFLKNRLMDFVSKSEADAGTYEINDADISEINKLVRDKFSTWEWNYAYGPDFTFRKKSILGKYPVDLQMKISKAHFESCSISGPEELQILEQLLPGTKFCYEDIKELMERNGLPSDEDSVYYFLS